MGDASKSGFDAFVCTECKMTLLFLATAKFMKVNLAWKMDID